MSEIKICAALSKNSGREILKFLQEKGENIFSDWKGIIKITKTRIGEIQE